MRESARERAFRGLEAWGTELQLVMPDELTPDCDGTMFGPDPRWEEMEAEAERYWRLEPKNRLPSVEATGHILWEEC